jgi:hypothetical protein
MIRKFTQPRAVVAVEQVAEVKEVLMGEAWPEPTDQCSIVFVGRGRERLPEVQRWIAPPDQPDAPPAFVVEHDGEIIRWRPGRAVVQCTPERRDEILALLAEFSFYEGELRAMESALEAREGQAQADVAIAYPIRKGDQKHWSRFSDSMKYFAQMRLTYARLEPRLLKASRTLPLTGQRLMSALLRVADVEDRLEAVDHRLEALEDFYEGVNDRVADYRWYRHGTDLEVGIIVLLAIETAIIAIDIYVHMHHI